MPARGNAATGSVRRWHLSLTILAWLLIVNAGLGAILGLLAVVSVPGDARLPAALAPYLGEAGIGAAARLYRQVIPLSWVSLAVNAVLLAGSVGLLARQKWGWFMVVLVELGTIVAGFVWLMPLLHDLLLIVNPHRAGFASFAIALLLALPLAAIIAFLMLAGVVRQFEAQKPETAAPGRPETD